MQNSQALRDALNQHFGEASVGALETGGLLVLADSLETAAEYLQDADFFSKINNRTRTIVPDALAHEGNPDGILAKVDFKGKRGFPSGDIVLEKGFHQPHRHRGAGAIHLIGSLIEDSSRDFYPEESNKTESAAKAVVDTLQTTTDVIRVPEMRRNTQFVFFSKKTGLALLTEFIEEKNVFRVTTYFGVRQSSIEKRWGNDRVHVSGANLFPEIGDAVSPHPWCQIVTDPTAETESLPGKSHGLLYSDVDYTGFVRDLIDKANESSIGREQSVIQGFYSRKHRQAFLIADALDDVSAPAVLLHEIGVHMAYDVQCRKDIETIVDQSPQILAQAAIRQDQVALRVQDRLTESDVFEGDPNYTLEACAYLVEESFKADKQSPATEYWMSRIKSGINVWLYNIGFHDADRLTHQELSLIARANVDTLSHDAELQRKILHPTEADSLDRLQWFLEKRLGRESGEAVTRIVKDLSERRNPEKTESRSADVTRRWF